MISNFVFAKWSRELDLTLHKGLGLDIRPFMLKGLCYMKQSCSLFGDTLEDQRVVFLNLSGFLPRK